MKDKISVCMATYNGQRFIKSQIESILKQLNKYDELIISDDGSSDGTLKIIKDFNDNRIKLIHHNFTNKKPLICPSSFYATSNFENALNYSTGDYIFLSDQDDIWAEDKVKTTVDLLKEKSGNLVISILNVINGDDDVIQINSEERKKSFLHGLLKCKYHGGAMAMDRIFLNAALPFPRKIVSHDNWMGLLATFQNRLEIINEPLLLYRRHGENVTWDVNNPLWFKIYYRLNYLFYVISRTYLKS